MAAPQNNKMKGLLKGLRYISQIFEDEKQTEMQIGLPTDVKHVAHIGWDGSSVNSTPGWMNEFSPGHRSAPLGTVFGAGVLEEDAVKWVSEDSKSKSARGTDSLPELPRSSRRSSGPLPELPKSSRRSSCGHGEVPAREKSDKPKHSRRSSKSSKEKEDSEGSAKPRVPKDRSQTSESASHEKKSRRKKSKDCSIGEGSSRRSRKQGSDNIPESELVSTHRQPSVDFEAEEKRLTGVY
ncbi:hypothetical protein SLA2020_163010 [Shorea laevis]